jgi:hypothetical protein
VGIRIPLTLDMEENLRIVPEFWKASLQGKQFLEICRLSNGEPRRILGISVYKNPKETYYYYSGRIWNLQWQIPTICPKRCKRQYTPI